MPVRVALADPLTEMAPHPPTERVESVCVPVVALSAYGENPVSVTPLREPEPAKASVFPLPWSVARTPPSEPVAATTETPSGMGVLKSSPDVIPNVPGKRCTVAPLVASEKAFFRVLRGVVAAPLFVSLPFTGST
jgi:hypothetical protein